MYRIDFNAALNLLDIGWDAPFDPETVGSYARQVAMRFGDEGFRPGYRLRIDMSRSGVQSRNALLRFESAFRDFPKASRIAIITGSALMRLQVRRIMTQPYLRIFDDAWAGLDWLLEDEAEPLSPRSAIAA